MASGSSGATATSASTSRSSGASRNAGDAAIRVATSGSGANPRPLPVVERHLDHACLPPVDGERRRQLARHAEWRPPAGLAQGALAGVPVKVLATAEATLIVVPLPFAAELVERVA